MGPFEGIPTPKYVMEYIFEVGGIWEFSLGEVKELVFFENLWPADAAVAAAAAAATSSLM